MPGDLAGSPALTFAPLALPADGEPPSGSAWAMMRRRYNAYRDAVVRPFFRDHFARLDRQIVLVDVLAALDAGPEAMRDLAGRHGRGARLLPDRPRRLAQRAVFGRAPTASCSRRPRPISCTTPRMTGSKRSSSR